MELYLESFSWRCGDVTNQLLHGSFPNFGYERRVTVNFGFQAKRSSVLGTQGGGIHSESQVFNEEVIERRSRLLGYSKSSAQTKISFRSY